MTPTGDLVQIGREYSGYFLTLKHGHEEWLVDSPEKVSIVLARNVASYNSDYDNPSWDDVDVTTLKPVKVTTEITKEVIDLDTPVVLKSYYNRLLTSSIASRYVGEPLPGRYYICGCSDLSVHELVPFIGKRIMQDSYSQPKLLVKVIEMPEDAPRDKGTTPKSMLIFEEHDHYSLKD